MSTIGTRSAKYLNDLIMSRTPTHVIETQSRDRIRKAIDDYYVNGDALFREITERDYGIDAIIELFSGGNPTGQIAFVQIKGTQNTISPLKPSPNVSCTITPSNAEYARQKRIPVILIYVCVKKDETFYYARLQDIVTDAHVKKINKQKSITVRIPINNSSADSLEPLFSLIRDYYEC